MIPKRQTCGTPMINAHDHKTGKINKHLWKCACKCNERIRVSIG
jgi:hypothetical protein